MFCSQTPGVLADSDRSLLSASSTRVHLSLHIHTIICIYIYIYIERERERERDDAHLCYVYCLFVLLLRDSDRSPLGASSARGGRLRPVVVEEEGGFKPVPVNMCIYIYIERERER